MNPSNWESRQWWVERWLELLDSYRFKKRLERARIYAREGNVLSIDFIGSQVIAQVQGSEVNPYQVSLSLEQFSLAQWQDVMETMGEKAIFLAQLLAGEMPARIEEVFTANGLNLFPYNLGEIDSHCTCPDKANPCKHIGAVYYQLADRFQEDPFVIFQLRGQTRDNLITALRQLKSQPSSVTPVMAEAPVPVATDLTNFWCYNEPLEPALVEIKPPEHRQTVLDVLGSPPLSYSEAQAIENYLKQIYLKFSQPNLS